MTGRLLDPRCLSEYDSREWEGVLIHHSATSPTATVQSIRDYHVKHNGWAAIGYHGIASMRPDGGYQFEPGRGLDMVGSHCPGKNKTHLGLCLIGNFMHGTPPIAQLEVAARVLAEWCTAFDFSPDEIYPHSAFRKTECPGAVDIAGLRARVLALLDDRGGE